MDSRRPCGDWPAPPQLLVELVDHHHHCMGVGGVVVPGPSTVDRSLTLCLVLICSTVHELCSAMFFNGYTLESIIMFHT